ncbi:MAG: hypothetical protein WCP12_13835 [bacterium]
MNVSIESIKNLSKPVLVSIGVTVFSLLGGIAVIILLILPLRERCVVVQKEVNALQSTLTTMIADIKKTDEQVKKTAQLKLKRDEWITTGTLVPYLGSLWMGAKSLMGPVAQTTGFKLEGVKDYPPILLRLPTPVPETIYARQPIEFIGRGSFEQIIGFIQETENKYPLTILSGLVILTQLQTPECHKAVITFEWPVKYEWLLAGPAGQK